MLPQARHEGLTIREMADETLVYDLERNKAHCLNRTAALVWQHCDGQTSIAELAKLLHTQLGIPADEAVVRLSLEQLQRRHLLVEKSIPARVHGRRDVLKRLGVAAALLPLVMSLTAPKAQAQISVQCVGLCNSDRNCDNLNQAGKCICRGNAFFTNDGRCVPSV